MKIEVISTVIVGQNNQFKTVQGGKHGKSGKKAKNHEEKKDDGFKKAFDLIKTAEQMEENNYRKVSSGGSAENRGSNSLSSNDSLIQTQRKLKQEYAVRLSQQNMEFVNQPKQGNHGFFDEKTPQVGKQDDDKKQKLGGK